MKIFSDEWWDKCGVRTIPVGCASRFLSATEKQDVEMLRRSQQDWWSLKDGGGYGPWVFQDDRSSTYDPDGDYPHENYDYSTDDQNDYEYKQDQYS